MRDQQLVSLIAILFLVGACGGNSDPETEKKEAEVYMGVAWNSGDSATKPSDYWSVTVDQDGNVSGSGVSLWGAPFSVKGTLSSDGKLSFTATGTAGALDSVATFSGTVNSSTGETSGSWSNKEFDAEGSFEGTRQSTKSIKVADYFVAELGSFWRYQGKDHGSLTWDWQEEERIDETEVLDGKTTFRVEHYDSGYMNLMEPYEIDLVQLQDQSVALVGWRQLANPDWDDDPIGLTTFEPALSFPSSLQLGEEAKISFQVVPPMGDKVQVTATVQLLGFEDVVVDAGSFPNAARLRSAFGSDVSIEWWAPQVGSVKQVSVEIVEKREDIEPASIVELESWRVGPAE